MDSQGIVPAELERICERLRQRGLHPKLLYTVPVGQNPTGSRLAADR